MLSNIRMPRLGRRLLGALLAGALLMGLVACGKAPEPEVTSLPTEPPETTAQTLPETEPTETVPEEGFLYLTVSKITFTLPGETEDIYTGTIPREAVTWTSGDESVVTVSDGVLTAVGVGETTITAEYLDQTLTCVAGCLAESQEALAELDDDLIRAPKRLPPQVQTDTTDYFADTAIIGDSITWIMFQWHTRNGGLGSPVFLSRGGTGINGLARNYKPIYFKGGEMAIEDALYDSGVKKAFIMLGQNDLSYLSIDDTMERWEALLERIRSKNPDLDIYLQSVIPEWFETTASNEKNEKIETHNALLQEFAQEHDCHYVEIAAYVKDHADKLATEYSMDRTIHMNDEGCAIWVQTLNAYAEYQTWIGEEST